ncbi:MAG: hypothetical protein PBV54_20180 [Achromobacter xylosoxidans]
MICSSYERHSDPGGSTFFSNALPAARMLASTNSYTDDLKIPDASLPPNTYVHPHFFEQKHVPAVRAWRGQTPFGTHVNMLASA